MDGSEISTDITEDNGVRCVGSVVDVKVINDDKLKPVVR